MPVQRGYFSASGQPSLGRGLLISKAPAREPIPAGPGEVSFFTVLPPRAVLCRLGATSAVLSGGVGGWNDIDRPGREQGIEWGQTPTQILTIPILLDGLVERREVESAIAALRTMGRPPAGSPRGTTPPIVKVTGMVPHGNRQWVITGFDEGDAVWDGKVRIRLTATVTLSAYTPLDLIKINAKKSTAKVATRLYTVKRGDTLGSIAIHQLGAATASEVASGVRVLKTLNKLRSSKSLKVGSKIKLPRDQAISVVGPPHVGSGLASSAQ